MRSDKPAAQLVRDGDVSDVMMIARRSGEEGLLHPLLFEGPLGLFHQLGGEEEYQGRGRAGLKI